MRTSDKIEVRQNLRLVARERGKIVARRDGHNIFLNLGREWLAGLIGYSSFSPLTTERDDRVRYMGFGIGGTRQTATALVSAPPFSTAYPGTNTQTDLDATLSRLERPVRVSGGSLPYPGDVNDLWLAQVQAPPSHATPTAATFRRLLTLLDVSYTPFLSVPLTEVMLFTSAANPVLYNNAGVAYDTFDPLHKTSGLELEAVWELRF